MNYEPRKCLICNSTYTPKAFNQKYCSVECKLEKGEVERIRRLRAKHAKNKQNTGLNEIDMLAEEVGLSYGKYVAKTEYEPLVKIQRGKKL